MNLNPLNQFCSDEIQKQDARFPEFRQWMGDVSEFFDQTSMLGWALLIGVSMFRPPIRLKNQQPPKRRLADHIS